MDMWSLLCMYVCMYNVRTHRSDIITLKTQGQVHMLGHMLCMYVCMYVCTME